MPQPSPQNVLGSPFVELQSVDSTNNYARHLIHEGLAQHGQAIFAHEQFIGKGQRNKTWVSESGVNILLSLIIKPALQMEQQFALSAGIAVAAHAFFTKYAGDEVRIKWPNDLYWQDRKAGGILIETTIRSSNKGSTAKWDWAVAGIGININQGNFPAYLKNPVSLLQITGRLHNPVELAKELCMGANAIYQEIINGGSNKVYKEYLDSLYKKNEIIKLRKDNRVFEARLKTVNGNGKLVVEHALEEEFDFGEVEWIID